MISSVNNEQQFQNTRVVVVELEEEEERGSQANEQTTTTTTMLLYNRRKMRMMRMKPPTLLTRSQQPQLLGQLSMFFTTTSTLLLLLLVVQLQVVVEARPVVRNIQSTHEFDRLLVKHATETGMPVVVDFYSDSCGPCRMMAPIFKQVAANYVDSVVFVKVDTNRQPELSSRYNVRSLPTFLYLVNGQVSNQALGGIGEGALRQQTDALLRQSELENTVLTLDALSTYYQQYDATKQTADIESIYTKCVKMMIKKFNPNQECIGNAANTLARKLKKKYGKGPTLQPRFTPESRQSSSSGSSKEDEGSTKSSSSTKRDTHKKTTSSSTTNDPQLHLASLEQLQAEIERRMDEIRDATVDAEDADDDEADPILSKTWDGPHMYPEAVVIIGGGPAGMAAAIYAARAGLHPLVIAPSMGGQLQGKGVEVENYPGLFNQTGPAVVAAMRLQAAMFGAVFEDDTVYSILVDRHPAHEYGNNSKPKPIQVITNNTGTIETHALIVATGAEANWLGIPGEYALRGAGVSSCAVCDGFLYSHKHVIVVGGGDAAMEDALVLARTSQSVTVLHRRSSFRASKVLADRVLHHPLITVRWNTIVQEIVGKHIATTTTTSHQQQQPDDDEESVVIDMDHPPAPPMEQVVAKVIVKDVVTGELQEITTDAVFVAIGHTPNTQFLQDIVEFDPNHPGYIHLPQPGSTQTSVKGIFAAGDVSDAIYRQAITSAGSGAAAALDAERYLSEHGLGNEAAELEAELMAELLSSSSDSNNESNTASSSTYNVYNDVGGRMEGMKESIVMAGEL